MKEHMNKKWQETAVYRLGCFFEQCHATLAHLKMTVDRLCLNYSVTKHLFKK